jgi:hypothetical protein
MSESIVHIKNPSGKPVWCHAFTNVSGDVYRWNDFEGSTKEITYRYDNKFKIFSWMFSLSGGINFEPAGCTPIVNDMTVTFHENRTEISHWAFDCVNNTQHSVIFCASYDSGKKDDFVVDAKSTRSWIVTSGDKISDISVKVDNTPISVTKTPKTGMTFTINEDKKVSAEELKLKLPVCDVATKIWNQSSDYIWIRIYTDTERWSWFSLKPRQNPFIWFMSEHPINIQYSRINPNDGEWIPEKVIPWQSGMSVIIRPKGLSNTSEQVIEILEKLGMSEKYGALVDAQDLDYESFMDLSEAEMKEIGLPLGPRKRIQREIKNLIKVNKPKIADGLWDLFLSHRQLNGGDLAQSIKLQLELLSPSIKIFLDVDDLNHLHILENNVINSRNFLLLITEGSIDRPFVQKEIRYALNNKKNIIIVHDERSCPFPSSERLPEDIREVLNIKAIPYIREKAFREVCISKILEKMIF